MRSIDPELNPSRFSPATTIGIAGLSHVASRRQVATIARDLALYNTPYVYASAFPVCVKCERNCATTANVPSLKSTPCNVSRVEDSFTLTSRRTGENRFTNATRHTNRSLSRKLARACVRKRDNLRLPGICVCHPLAQHQSFETLRHGDEKFGNGATPDGFLLAARAPSANCKIL